MTIIFCSQKWELGQKLKENLIFGNVIIFKRNAWCSCVLLIGVIRNPGFEHVITEEKVAHLCCYYFFSKFGKTIVCNLVLQCRIYVNK